MFTVANITRFIASIARHLWPMMKTWVFMLVIMMAMPWLMERFNSLPVMHEGGWQGWLARWVPVTVYLVLMGWAAEPTINHFYKSKRRSAPPTLGLSKAEMEHLGLNAPMREQDHGTM